MNETQLDRLKSEIKFLHERLDAQVKDRDELWKRLAKAEFLIGELMARLIRLEPQGMVVEHPPK